MQNKSKQDVNAKRGAWLLLDGSLPRASAAVARQGRLLEVSESGDTPRSRFDLIGAVRELMEKHGIETAHLEGIAVGLGPGSFTGTRVALAFARSLAMVRPRLAVAAADSLQLMLAEISPVEQRENQPLTIVLPWGRWRAMLVDCPNGEPDTRTARLIASERLANDERIRAGRIVTFANGSLHDRLPAETELIEVSPVGASSLWTLIQCGTARRLKADELHAEYLVPPDAVRPVSAADLRHAVRSLDLTDLSAAMRLRERGAATTWSEDSLERELRIQDGRVALGIVGEDDELSGMLFARFDDETLEVQDVVVSCDRRRRGFGKSLLRRALQIAVEKGLKRVDLEVSAANIAAVQLYERVGFIAVGRRRSYYPDGTDAVLMSLVLSRHDA